MTKWTSTSAPASSTRPGCDSPRSGIVGGGVVDLVRTAWCAAGSRRSRAAARLSAAARLQHRSSATVSAGRGGFVLVAVDGGPRRDRSGRGYGPCIAYGHCRVSSAAAGRVPARELTRRRVRESPPDRLPHRLPAASGGVGEPGSPDPDGQSPTCSTAIRDPRLRTIDSRWRRCRPRVGEHHGVRSRRLSGTCVDGVIVDGRTTRPGSHDPAPVRRVHPALALLSDSSPWMSHSVHWSPCLPAP